MVDFEKEKALAAKEASKLIGDGMVVGVGSGTTTAYFIKYLGEQVRNGLNIIAVPTSNVTSKLCKQEGIPVVDANVPLKIDITVDGADEFDSTLTLIKGGGGDLLHEKIIASATKREIIIVDSRKYVKKLGESFPLPVEVIPFSWPKVAQHIKKYKGTPILRLNPDKSPFITDEGNYILDCKFNEINNPEELNEVLTNIVGLVENGLFINLATEVIMAQGDKIVYFNKKHKLNKVIEEDVQKNTINKLFDKIEQVIKKGEKPVVEIDLDLTAFDPANRTIKALKAAGSKYNISEFLNPETNFDLLPGYTREAWTNFLCRNKLSEKYPHLKWLGYKDATGDETNVYSVFHTTYWTTEWLIEDTLVAGIVDFVKEIEQKGAVALFISGRWDPLQFTPSREILIRGGISNPVLLIGNPQHDKISDAESKALKQEEIRKDYGTPVAIIDDRIDNRAAVCNANPGIDMLSIGISIPDFTYDEEVTGISLKISTFENYLSKER